MKKWGNIKTPQRHQTCPFLFPKNMTEDHKTEAADVVISNLQQRNISNSEYSKKNTIMNIYNDIGFTHFFKFKDSMKV